MNTAAEGNHPIAKAVEKRPGGLLFVAVTQSSISRPETRHAPILGVVMDFFRPGVVDGAGAYARQHGLRIDARWAVRADWMESHPGWQAVIARFVDMHEAYRRVCELGLPTVHLSGWIGRNRTIPRVEHDAAACARLAVDEFARLGLKRVAGMTPRPHAIEVRAYRSMRLAARKRALEYIPLPADGDKDVGRRAKKIAATIGGLPRPTGLFLVHAGFAWSLVDALEDLGICVPEDFPLIVIDKDAQQTCKLAAVPLTAVALDDWRQGYEAARRAHRLVLGIDNAPPIVRVPPLGIVRRESTGRTTHDDPVVGKALHLIENYATTGLDVETLAARTGVSRRKLEQHFRSAAGTTPHAALLQARIDAAKRLLASGDPLIATVAEECGFASPHYFTTVFRKMVGVPPGRYRNELPRDR